MEQVAEKGIDKIKTGALIRTPEKAKRHKEKEDNFLI